MTTETTTTTTQATDSARGFRPMAEAFQRRMREEYDTEALRAASRSPVLSQEARDYAAMLLAKRGL